MTRLLAAIPLLSLPFQPLALPKQIDHTQATINVDVIHLIPDFVPAPSPTPDYNTAVLAPLRAAQAQEAKVAADIAAKTASCQADGGTYMNATCVYPVIAPAPVTQSVASSTSGYSGGYANSYNFGECTWYVASRRPVPSDWGNANQWYAAAQASGYSTGSIPRAGAVGVSFVGYYGHVVYVEGVNSDGSINISEMNNSGLGGWDIVDYRVAAASDFSYIY